MGIAEYLQEHRVARQPRIWVKRLAIFDDLGTSFNSSPLVRNLPLFRGLNIVQGIELTSEERRENSHREVSGHEAGKTLFCRLVRHCLGEHRYGTKAQMLRIERSFPKGYVGAEIVLDGNLWSVLRPISAAKQSHAGAGLSLEELIPVRAKNEHLQYDRFREAVGRLLTMGIRGLHSDDDVTRWLTLLSWLARDQQARFRDLWRWRARDESHDDSPVLPRPREDGLRLIQGVLGLLGDDADTISERIAKLRSDSNKLETQIAEKKAEPEYWRREHHRNLQTEIDSRPDLEDVVVFGFDRQVEVLIDRLVDEEEKLGKRIAQLQVDATNVAALLQRTERRVASESTALEISAKTTEGLKEPESDDVVERLRQYANKHCMAVGIPIRDCQHFQDLQKDAPSVVAVSEERVAQVSASKAKERETNEARWRKSIDEEKEERDRLRGPVLKRLAKLNDDITAMETLLRQLVAQKNRIVKSRAALLDAEAILAGRKPNTELARLISLKSDADAELRRLETRRDVQILKHKQSFDSVGFLFREGVEQVIGPGYEGRVGFADGFLNFGILRGESTGGEAIQSMSVVLADIVATLAGVVSIGHHPGFLIHDSPREADLNAWTYGNFLRFAWRLHEVLGAEDNAPFQYIVTTTTPPPAEIPDRLVRLKLKTYPINMLLYKTPLGRRVDEGFLRGSFFEGGNDDEA